MSWQQIFSKLILIVQNHIPVAYVIHPGGHKKDLLIKQGLTYATIFTREDP